MDHLVILILCLCWRRSVPAVAYSFYSPISFTYSTSTTIAVADTNESRTPKPLLANTFIRSSSSSSSRVWKNDRRLSPKSHLLWATPRTRNNDATIIAPPPTQVNGLLPDSEFRRRQDIHKTLASLQVHLPALLTRALTESEAQKVYTVDTKLIVINHQENNNKLIELANSRNEIISVSQSIVLSIILASNAADSLFNLASGSRSTRNDENNEENKPFHNKKYVVKCDILLNPEQILPKLTNNYNDEGGKDIVLEVDWETDLLPILPTRLSSGISMVSDDVSKTKTSSESRTSSRRSFDVKRTKNSRTSGSSTTMSTLPTSIQSLSRGSRISGISILTLDHKAKYKVSCHELTNICWNDDVAVDPVVIGQTLSFLRQTTQTISKQTVPIPFLSQATSIWNQVRDEVLLRQSTALQNDKTDRAPIFLFHDSIGNDKDTDKIRDEYQGTSNSARSLKDDKKLTDSADSKKDYTSIDDFVITKANEKNNTAISEGFFILPGSIKWIDYVTCHQVSHDFVQYIIPYLSGKTSDSLDITSIFAPDARLVTLDGTVLIRGSNVLENFYQSLVSLRRLSLGEWCLKNVTMLEYYSEAISENCTVNKENEVMIIKIQVVYSTSLDVPSVGRVIGTSAPQINNNNGLSIQGTDIYILSVPLKTEYVIEEDDAAKPVTFQIKQVEQKKLILGRSGKIDEKVSTNQQDGIMFMKSLVSAMESGTLRTIDSSTTFVLDLVQLLTNPTSAAVKAGILDSRNKSKKSNYMPVRSDEAATMVYRIMESLHRDLRRMVDTTSSTRNNAPPANAFMLNNVQLVGYLDEVLVRGRTQYIQSVGLLITALQVALRSGRIISEKDPMVQVELTSTGNVRCSFSIFLKLNPSGLFPDLVIGGGLADAATDRIPPLNLKLVSEYVINPETGGIEKHRLLESRLNGQLTPGDVASRWIQRFMSGFAPSSSYDNNSNNDEEAPWIRNLLIESVTWMLSMNK